MKISADVKISSVTVAAATLVLAASPLAAPRAAAATPGAAAAATTAFAPAARSGQPGVVRLGRQAVAAQPGLSYRADGTFFGRVPAGMAHSPAPAAAVHAGPKYTLTLNGTTLPGEPGTEGFVAIANMKNPNLTHGFVSKELVGGTATFYVPAGPYLVAADFLTVSGRRITGTHQVVLPQVTVTGNTTATVDERLADSEVQLSTPRPASLLWESLDVYRETAGHMLFDINAYSQNQGPIWTNTTSGKVTGGWLRSSVEAGLRSPAGTTAPYLYNLVLGFNGIPVMRQKVRPAQLATLTARYYQAAPSTGQLYWRGLLPYQGGIIFGGGYPVSMPGTVTEYLSGTPSVTWFDEYAASNYKSGWWMGGQIDANQAYVPGEHLTQDWGAYPLHPAPVTSVLGAADPFARHVPQVPVPAASRMGNSLLVQIQPFGDNTPGHTGSGYTSGHYQIDENGVRIGGGNAQKYRGNFAFSKLFRLSQAPSLVKFTLSTARSGTIGVNRTDPLSTAASTTWTWRSARAPWVKLPLGWWCGQGPITPSGIGSRACAVQPMLTLRYTVQNLALNGSTPAGQQVVRLAVGHLQLARNTPIVRAAMQVSFDGGHSWHPAEVVGRDGSYTALFRAPAGAKVTMRTSAADADGGSITETITSGYATAA